MTPADAMNEAPIRAVFFDAVGTLIHPEPPAVEVYAEVGTRHGSRLRPSRIRRGFHAACLREENADRQAGWCTSEARELERWRSIVAEVLHDAVDQEACFRVLYEHFSLPASWRCSADSCGLLADLTKRGWLLGLASNFDGRLRRVAAGLPELASMRHMVISSEIGWRKPSPHFFEAMCAQVGLPPQEILYVGDDRNNDYAAALASGCQAVLFDRASQAAGAVRRITVLTELIALAAQK